MVLNEPSPLSSAFLDRKTILFANFFIKNASFTCKILIVIHFWNVYDNATANLERGSSSQK